MIRSDPIRCGPLSISEAICVYFYVFDKCILRGVRSLALPSLNRNANYLELINCIPCQEFQDLS